MKDRHAALILSDFLDGLNTKRVFCKGCQLAISEKEATYNKGLCTRCAAQEALSR